MERPDFVEEAEEAEGREGEPPLPGRGGREGALFRYSDEILRAVLKKGKVQAFYKNKVTLRQRGKK